MGVQITILSLAQKKREQEKIVAVTCYDATMARLVGMSPVDVVLVGDSLGMVMHGHTNTLSVTVDHVVVCSASVSRVLKGPLIVADMPFMSYHISREETCRHAARLMTEGGAHAVKVEGATDAVCEAIERLVESGIPVMGHLGFTPQSIHQIGGYKSVKNSEEALKKLLSSAQRLVDAGAFALVLEMVAADLAAEVASQVVVPVIGIGSGRDVDGQILVLQDLLGMNSSFRPKFVKTYCDLESTIINSVSEYSREVRAGEFPDSSHSYGS